MKVIHAPFESSKQRGGKEKGRYLNWLKPQNESFCVERLLQTSLSGFHRTRADEPWEKVGEQLVHLTTWSTSRSLSSGARQPGECYARWCNTWATFSNVCENAELKKGWGFYPDITTGRGKMWEQRREQGLVLLGRCQDCTFQGENMIQDGISGRIRREEMLVR